MPAKALPEGCEPACRGCAHGRLSAVDSAAQKQAWLARALAPWVDRLAPLRTPDRRLGYRDRVALSAQWLDGAWRVGMLQRDAVLDIRHCPVHSPRVRDALAALLPALPPGEAFPLAFYVQAGAQLTLVLKTAQMPPLAWLDDALSDALARAGVEALWLQLYPAAGRHLFHKRGWRLLWGHPESRDAEGLVYGPAAFQQLIPALYRQSLDAAQAFLAPRHGDRVVDLYCGNGRSLRRWDEAGARTLGVERGAEAVTCAARNAAAATLLRGPCAQRLPQVRAWAAAMDGGDGSRRLLYANPPRTGLESEVRAWLAEDYLPRRLAYLSCSAGTLRRDLAALCEAGYAVSALMPYDFFPRTHHVECLALLQREE